MVYREKYEDIEIEVTPSSLYALRNGETHLYIQLKLIGSKIQVEETRTDLNLGVVLDRSGSMRGSKIKKAKEAVEFIINNLSQSDVFALTIYDHHVETVIPSAKLTNKTAVINKLLSIRDRGRTNLHGGLIDGAKQVETSKHLENRNILLLLSDGLANEGITDRNQIREAVKNIYDGGTSISTFGVGEDFDEDLMVDIADAAGGSFYFIATADDIPRIIEQEFKGLLATSAYNLEVSWKTHEGVKIQRVLGVPYQERLASDTKLGDIRSENEQIIILDIILPAAKDEENIIEVVNFSVQWIPRTGSTTFTQAKIPCPIKYTTDENLLAAENELVLENVYLLEASYIQSQAMEMADHGNFGEARTKMRGFQEKLDAKAAQTGSLALKSLSQQNREIIDEVLKEESYSKAARKRMHYKMYSLRKSR